MRTAAAMAVAPALPLASLSPATGMRRLEVGRNVIDQLYPGGDLYVPNLGNEIVEGNEFAPHRAVDGVPRSYVAQTIGIYKPRLAAALPVGSAIVVPETLVPAVQETLGYLRDLGLSVLPDAAVIGVREIPGQRFSASVLAASGALLAGLDRPTHVLPFIQSPETTALAQRLGLQIDASAAASDLANNKVVGYRALPAYGVAVPFGGEAHTEAEVRDLYATIKGRGAAVVYMKLARAVSGEGVRPLTTAEDLETFLRDERVQLQLADPTLGIRLDAEIDAELFPNVMFHVGRTPAEDRFIMASRQRLAKKQPSDEHPSVHIGNIGPLTAALEEALLIEVQKVAHWLRSIGAYGFCGTDFVVERGTGRIFWLENNFRINGSCHFGFLAMARGARVWAGSNKVAVPQNISLWDYVAFLRRAGLHYDRDTGIGAFVVNALTARHGQMQVGVIAPDYAEAERLLAGAAEMVVSV